MVAKLITLPRTLLIVGALAIAPALAQTPAPVAPISAMPAAPAAPAEAPTVKHDAVKPMPVVAPIKPVAKIEPNKVETKAVDSKKVDPKLQPVTTAPAAPAATTTPKS